METENTGVRFGFEAELTQYTKLGHALLRKEESFMSLDHRFVAWHCYKENRRAV